MCTGNICRSPIAERLAASLGVQHHIPLLHASSAGTSAVIGHAMDPRAASALDARGVESKGFVARQLTSPIAESADLVLAMTHQHRDAVLEMAPSLLRRTFTLFEASRLVSDHAAQSVSELAEKRPYLAGSINGDIQDPVNSRAEVFEAIAKEIEALLPPVLSLASGNRS